MYSTIPIITTELMVDVYKRQVMCRPTIAFTFGALSLTFVQKNGVLRTAYFERELPLGSYYPIFVFIYIGYVCYFLISYF